MVLPKAYLAQRNPVLIQKGLSEPRPFIVLNLKFPFSFTKCYGSSVPLQWTLSSASVSLMNICQLGFAGRLQEKTDCELSNSLNLIARNYLNRSILLKMGTVWFSFRFFVKGMKWNFSIGISRSMQLTESTVCFEIAVLDWQSFLSLVCHVYSVVINTSPLIFVKASKSIVWTGAYWKIALLSDHWSIVYDMF